MSRARRSPNNNNVPETPEQQAPTPTRRPRQIHMTPPPNYSGPPTDGVTTFVTSSALTQTSTDGAGNITMRTRRRRNRIGARPRRRPRSPGAVLPTWFTALKTALMKRDSDHVITILAQSGSDLLRQEINGKSLLDIMGTNGDFLVARILLERGILHKSAVVKMIKKYLQGMDITLGTKLKHLFELFDSLDKIGEDDTYHILSDRLPRMMMVLVERLNYDELDREVILETSLKDNITALNMLIDKRIRDIDMSVRKRMLEILAPVFAPEFEMEDWDDYEYRLDQLKSLLHTKYAIGKRYKLEEFALIDFDDKSNRLLQLKDPAKDATTNCSFMGNKGDREGPVKILVEKTNPTIKVEDYIIDDRTNDRYRITYKGPKIDNNTEVIVTYATSRSMMSTVRQKAMTADINIQQFGTFVFSGAVDDPNLNEINVILRKNVIPIEFTVMPTPEWATEDGKILHVFCGKDMQKYLETNDRSPFDRRNIVGVQFLTTKEIREQETLLMRQMQSKVNTNLLKTPPLKSRASPKAPPPIDPVDVLQKRLNNKFTMQDSVLLQRIKNMRNLLKNPKLSKENEVLYKQKLEEYMKQISDPQDALIKRKEKERDNLLIQQMETREQIQKYQEGRLRWTDEQAEYYQDLMNSFPRMIERLDNEIENMKNSRDGASKLKKPRLKKFKF